MAAAHSRISALTAIKDIWGKSSRRKSTTNRSAVQHKAFLQYKEYQKEQNQGITAPQAEQDGPVGQLIRKRVQKFAELCNHVEFSGNHSVEHVGD